MEGAPRDRKDCRKVHHNGTRAAYRATGAKLPDHKKRQKKKNYPELSEFIPAGTPAVNDYPDDNKNDNDDANDEENPAR